MEHFSAKFLCDLDRKHRPTWPPERLWQLKPQLIRKGFECGLKCGSSRQGFVELLNTIFDRHGARSFPWLQVNVAFSLLSLQDHRSMEQTDQNSIKFDASYIHWITDQYIQDPEVKQRLTAHSGQPHSTWTQDGLLLPSTVDRILRSAVSRVLVLTVDAWSWQESKKELKWPTYI